MPLTTHGQSYTRTYRSWSSMKNRCANPRNVAYHKYGGRGIHVCDEWVASFETFLRDMGERPCGTSIDRIDNDRGYSPDNCRWATPAIQGLNTRAHGRFLDLEDKPISMKAIAFHLAMPQSTWRFKHTEQSAR